MELTRTLMSEGLLIQDERRGTSHDSLEEVAIEIQSALADLLEKAHAITNSSLIDDPKVPMRAVHRVTREEMATLKAALEPWRKV